MRSICMRSIAVCAMCAAAFAVAAGQQVKPLPITPGPGGTVPLFQVTVIGRTVTAVNFRVLGDETALNLRGTNLLPAAEGKATVQIERGATHIHADFRKVNPAQRFGPEYLTYVLWAITPDGHAKNLGEVQLSGQSASLDVTTTLQQFGMIVTAEPYFAVSRPSELVVMEGQVRPNTVGAEALVEAKASLLQRGQYRLHVDPNQVTPLPQDPNVVLDLYEAQNAVRIAKWAGARQYASAGLEKAEVELKQAEADQFARESKANVATAARAAVQTAEDARLATLHLRQQAAADAATAAAAVAQQQADSARAQADSAQQQAATAQQQAADARAAESAAEQAQARAQQQADAARTAARAARMKLLAQLNSVMQTRDTAQGLIMNMPDVLFALNQSVLEPTAQVKLAKVAGILLAYPGLKVQVDGYTDSTGTDEYNQQLSEKRAYAVEAFLAEQGVSAEAMHAQGFGPSDPIASNDSVAGRQLNRRVDLVVTGAAIAANGPSN